MYPKRPLRNRIRTRRALLVCMRALGKSAILRWLPCWNNHQAGKIRDQPERDQVSLRVQSYQRLTFLRRDSLPATTAIICSIQSNPALAHCRHNAGALKCALAKSGWGCLIGCGCCKSMGKQPHPQNATLFPRLFLPRKMY